MRLMMRVKTRAGWRHCPAAYAANNRVKPWYAVIAGQEVKFTTGYYELRYYRRAKILFEALRGVSPAEAEARRKRKEAQLLVVKAAGKVDVRIEPLDPRRPSLASELERFLTAASDRGSLEAREVYEFACNEFLEVTGRQFVEEILPDDLVMYHRKLFERGMSVRTVSNRHSNVKAFLKFLDYDIKRLPKPPKYDKTLPQIYSDQELKALFERVTSLRENLLFRLLLQTGIREQEAMHLEWDDIDPKRKILKLESKVKRWGLRLKDFEERELPLGDDLLARLDDYKKEQTGTCTLIFDRDGNPDGHMLRTLKQEVRRAGLNCEKCDGCKRKPAECENWYLHKFRATFCTKMHRNPSMDMRTLQSLMGHSDLASTLRYLRPAENVQTQALVNKMKWV